MKRKTKQRLSLFLAVCMLLTLLSGAALAGAQPATVAEPAESVGIAPLGGTWPCVCNPTCPPAAGNRTLTISGPGVVVNSMWDGHPLAPGWVGGANGTVVIDPSSLLFEGLTGGMLWHPGDPHQIAPGSWLDNPLIINLYDEMKDISSFATTFSLVPPSGYTWPTINGTTHSIINPAFSIAGTNTSIANITPLYPCQHLHISPRWVPLNGGGPTNHAGNWELAGGNWGSVTPPPTSVPHNGTINAPAGDPVRPGHAFNGWNVNFPLQNVTGPITITANWTPTSHAITWNIGILGSWPSLHPPTSVAHNGTINAPVRDPILPGHTFSGWNVSFPIHNVTGPITITASWTPLSGGTWPCVCNPTCPPTVGNRSLTISGPGVVVSSFWDGHPLAPGWVGGPNGTVVIDPSSALFEGLTGGRVWHPGDPHQIAPGSWLDNPLIINLYDWIRDEFFGTTFRLVPPDGYTWPPGHSPANPWGSGSAGLMPLYPCQHLHISPQWVPLNGG